MYGASELTFLKRHWITKNSNIPRRFFGYEPADIVEKTGSFSPLIELWLENVLEGNNIKAIGGLGTTGVGLLFDGAPGLGKTTHAVVTAMEFVRRLPNDPIQARNLLNISAKNYGNNMRPIYYMTFPEFLSRKKAMFEADPETKAEMHLEMEGFHGRASTEFDHLNVRLLILDDLGKEYGSEYNDSSFDEILRSRYDKALPTIITTNVPREKWAKQYSEAMGSFAHEAFQQIEILGKDLRKASE
jgi:DNA replication protein DnaC